MSSVEIMIERMRVGQPTFNKLFEMKKDDLIVKLKDICSNNEKILEVLNEKPNLYREIGDDTPNEMKFCSWNTVIINTLGISYKAEHGNPNLVISFDKYFNLDA